MAALKDSNPCNRLEYPNKTKSRVKLPNFLSVIIPWLESGFVKLTFERQDIEFNVQETQEPFNDTLDAINFE
jgi:hypothetical protein